MSSQQYPDTIQGVKNNLAALTTLVQQKNTAIGEFNNVVTQRIREIRVKIDELKRQSAESSQRLAAIGQELEEVRRELQRSEGENQSLKERLAALERDKVGTIQEIQTINGQINQIRQLVTQIVPENPDLNAALSELEQLVNVPGNNGSPGNQGRGSGQGQVQGVVSLSPPTQRREDISRSRSFNLGDGPKVDFPSENSALSPVGTNSRRTDVFGGKKSRKPRIIKCRMQKRSVKRSIKKSKTLKRKQRGGFLAIYKQPGQSKKDKKDKKSKKDKKKSSSKTSVQSDNNDAYNF
jgi:hypothetical protein